MVRDPDRDRYGPYPSSMRYDAERMAAFFDEYGEHIIAVVQKLAGEEQR